MTNNISPIQSATQENGQWPFDDIYHGWDFLKNEYPHIRKHTDRIDAFCDSIRHGYFEGFEYKPQEDCTLVDDEIKKAQAEINLALDDHKSMAAIYAGIEAEKESEDTRIEKKIETEFLKRTGHGFDDMETQDQAVLEQIRAEIDKRHKRKAGYTGSALQQEIDIFNDAINDAINGGRKNKIDSEDEQMVMTETRAKQAEQTRQQIKTETKKSSYTEDEKLKLAAAICDEEGRYSAAKKVIRVLLEVEKPEFFLNNGEVYVSVFNKNHYENLKIKHTFKIWLAERHYSLTGQAASQSTVNTACNIVEGQARQTARELPVYNRVAFYNGKIYLDLCNDKYEYVEISDIGFKIVNDPPVKFVRVPGSLPLPYPDDKYGIDGIYLLKNHINIEESDFILLIPFIIHCFYPRGEFPLLSFIAGQGCGKSENTKKIKSLIDPNVCEMKSNPKNQEDCAIAACNGWLYCLDNLSFISDWLSDQFCRILSSGGYTKRELWTDSGEAVLITHRPIIINGIEDTIYRADLLGRSIILRLKPISEVNRHLSSKGFDLFNQDKIKIFTAILHLVSIVIKNFDSFEVKNSPRMAEYFRIGSIVNKYIGDENEFAETYREMNLSSNKILIDSNLFNIELKKYFDENRIYWRYGTYKTSATELLNNLNNFVNYDYIKNSDSWPKNPSKLSGKLNRLIEPFEKIGYLIDTDHREGKNRDRFISITYDNTKKQGLADATDATDGKILDESPTPKENIKENIHIYKDIDMEDIF